MPKSAITVEGAHVPPPPKQPPLPPMDTHRLTSGLEAPPPKTSMTAHLDGFIAQYPIGTTRSEIILAYLTQLSPDINNSQLLQSEVAYLTFAGSKCPIKYDPATDRWWTWSQYWKTSKTSMTRVGVFFKTEMLPCLRIALNTAVNQGRFPQCMDGSDHMRVVFLRECVEALEKRESSERVIKEACMLFDTGVEFDVNPDIFQLQNSVVDLKRNSIRQGSPEDMTSRASPVMIPEGWMQDPTVVAAESQQARAIAWDVCWSIFKRDGPHHPLDCFEQLGEQDVDNFKYFQVVLARLLEGRPLCKFIAICNPRGRNSKGIIEKMFISLWGDYYTPVRPTVFHADRRGENEHSAAELARKGVRIAFGNEVLDEPWSNAVFKNKNSTDPVNARGCGSESVERVMRTETFIFGMNDPPKWELRPKGSEQDRMLVLYTRTSSWMRVPLLRRRARTSRTTRWSARWHSLSMRWGFCLTCLRFAAVLQRTAETLMTLSERALRRRSIGSTNGCKRGRRTMMLKMMRVWAARSIALMRLHKFARSISGICPKARLCCPRQWSTTHASRAAAN